MSAALQIMFYNIFELSLTASIIAAVLLLIRKWGNKWVSPKVMSWLWILLLVKLVVPIPFPTAFNIETWTDKFLFDVPYINEALTKAAHDWRDLRSELGIMTLPNSELSDPHSLAFVDEMNARNEIINGLAMVWLAGCVIVVARLWHNQRKSKRLFRAGVPCEDEEIIQLFLSCKQELGVRRNIRLKQSGTISPVLIGWVRPTILLPYDYSLLYSAEELRYILLHELQHYKNKDIGKQMVSYWIDVVFWFQPVLRWAMRRLRKDIELGCDAAVLNRLNKEQAIKYGLLLIKQGQQHNKMLHTYNTGVYWQPNHSQLTERIEQISKQISAKPSKRKRLQGGLAILILSFILLPINPTYAGIDQFFGTIPTCYVFWLEEGIDPKALNSIEIMSQQIAGLPSNQEEITLIKKQKVERSWLMTQLSELWPVAMMQAQIPVKVATVDIKASLEHNNITFGQIVIMIQHHYATTKLSSFSGGQIVVLNVNELMMKDHVLVY